MFCSACGNEVPDGSAFCLHCGAPLATDALHPPAAPAQPAYQAGGAHGSHRDVPEEELWSGSYSPRAMTGQFILAAVLTVVAVAVGTMFPPIGWLIGAAIAVVVWIWLLAKLYYRKATVRYRLTTFRFFSETGLISRTNDRIQVISIDDVRVQQGPLDRMFNVGTIDLKSNDKTNPDLRLLGIENAQHVADLIDGARRAERNRRGLYTADM
jgi:membrane protein YdbS with pleckstrin-like domain